MATVDPGPARAALAGPMPGGMTVDRFSDMRGPDALPVATALVSVLVPAFGVGQERRPGIIAETLASLADPRFVHYLVRIDGAPAAVARRGTFDGLSYLSSIGTLAAARGRGLGRIVTATATVDGFSAGSELVHLGVFADNVVAKALYASLGFGFVGEAGPDMLLIG